MKLWKISQDKNNNYDTYDSAVVAAETEEAARYTPPSRYAKTPWDGQDESYSDWTAVENVHVEYLGEAKEGTKASVICASFNEG